MRLGLKDGQIGSPMPLPDFVPAVRQRNPTTWNEMALSVWDWDLLETSLEKVICDVVSLVKFPSAGRAVKAPLSDPT